jgi:WD40 repeat protein
MHTPNILALEKELKAHCSTEPIRSKFCRTVNEFHGITIVTGSEDNNVSFLDLSKGAKQSATISKLQGHFAVVYDVSLTEDESFLATCDGTGIVIVWKRWKNVDESK